MKTRNGFLGLVFIVLGALLIFDHYSIIRFSIWELWPLILLYQGINAERKYFNGEGGSGNLLTGATLISYSILFLLSSFTYWGISSRLWPIFILGPGLGFLQMYYYGHNRRHNFKIGIFLVTLSAIFLIDSLFNIPFDMVLYVGLVLFGLYLITRDRSDDIYDDFDSEYEQVKEEKNPRPADRTSFEDQISFKEEKKQHSEERYK